MTELTKKKGVKSNDNTRFALERYKERIKKITYKKEHKY
jgi:hypothetical protein